MRSLRHAFLLTVLVLALTAAGCGSSSDDVPEVPGPPAELSVPHQKGATDLGESASATPTPSAAAGTTPTPTATTGTGTGTTTGSTGTGTTGGTGTGTNGGTGTTGGTGTDTAQQPATTGTGTGTTDNSAPQKFEQFCQENAGAC